MSWILTTCHHRHWQYSDTSIFVWVYKFIYGSNWIILRRQMIRMSSFVWGDDAMLIRLKLFMITSPAPGQSFYHGVNTWPIWIYTYSLRQLYIHDPLLRSLAMEAMVALPWRFINRNIKTALITICLLRKAYKVSIFLCAFDRLFPGIRWYSLETIPLSRRFGQPIIS